MLRVDSNASQHTILQFSSPYGCRLPGPECLSYMWELRELAGPTEVSGPQFSVAGRQQGPAIMISFQRARHEPILSPLDKGTALEYSSSIVTYGTTTRF